MTKREWPASDYAIGSYIQASVTDQFLPELAIKADDAVLDIGCGNGSYSLKIIEKVPQGSFLGIDASENMLKLAKETAKGRRNAQFQQADVLSMTFDAQFDYVVSFWCLQWTNAIQRAFENIARALKKGGKFFTLFPSGNDPFMWTFEAVKQSGRFAALQHFVPPVNYARLHDGLDQLHTLPFKAFNLRKESEILTLPSLDTFRKFVNGIAFFQGHVPTETIPEINEAMVAAYDEAMKQHHQGNYRFEFSVFVVTGEK